MKDRIDEMADTLLRINAGEIPAEKAKELLSTIDEVELSLAEQRLLERGVAPEDLRGLCKVHLEVLDRTTSGLLKATRPGHPLHTLISEHELILGFLDSLDDAAEVIAGRVSWEEGDIDLSAAIDTVRDAAHHLIETEKHHAREEDALFPAIDERGITGPTRIMRLEHAELRPRKAELHALVSEVTPAVYPSTKDRIVRLASYIVFNLRDHIMKENTILYPAAFQAVPEEAVWDEIKAKCDAIGYCCFTPNPTSP